MNPTDELLFDGEDTWAAGGEPGDEHLSDIPGTCPVCCEVLGADAVEVHTTFGAAFVCPGCDTPPGLEPRSYTMTPVPAAPSSPPPPPRRPQQAPKGAPEIRFELGSLRIELHRSKATT